MTNSLTFGEKAELDALVNFFGGKTMLIQDWMRDPLHKSMHRKGLTRWGKKTKGGMVEHLATKRGTAIAQRFKVSWSERWAETHDYRAAGDD